MTITKSDRADYAAPPEQIQELERLLDRIIERAVPNTTGTYMTTTEAAAYIRMSKKFLEGARYRADGSGPALIKLDRAVRYRKIDLDVWMTAHNHAADKPL